MNKKTCLVLLVSVILLFFDKMAKAQESAKSEEEFTAWLMKKVAEKAAENEKIKRDYLTYDKTVTKYDMRGGFSKARGVETFRVYGEHGKSMEKMTEKNGRKINTKPEESELDFGRIMAERFDFSFKEQVLINGRGYFVINFKPKTPINKLPFNNDMDECINRMSGVLYIDVEKLYMYRLQGRLMSPFKKGPFGLLNIKGFSLRVEQEEKFGVIVPKYIEITLIGRVVFSDLNEGHVYTYSNHASKKISTGIMPVPR